jgi:hypothetical protein
MSIRLRPFLENIFHEKFLENHFLENFSRNSREKKSKFKLVFTRERSSKGLLFYFVVLLLLVVLVLVVRIDVSQIKAF